MCIYNPSFVTCHTKQINMRLFPPTNGSTPLRIKNWHIRVSRVFTHFISYNPNPIYTLFFAGKRVCAHFLFQMSSLNLLCKIFLGTFQPTNKHTHTQTQHGTHTRFLLLLAKNARGKFTWNFFVVCSIFKYNVLLFFLFVGVFIFFFFFHNLFFFFARWITLYLPACSFRPTNTHDVLRC